MPRGSKCCPQCMTVTGPRAFKCPKCHFKYSFKDTEAQPEKDVGFDWKTLTKGELIKVVGKGPFYKSKESGLRESIGYRGLFKVMQILDKGILTFSKTKREGGFCFIYMGPKDKSDQGTGVFRRAHKIKRHVEKAK